MNEEWISITEAAARLSGAGDSVDRSTLSRYIAQHGEALETRREGKSNLVEYGALAAHRGENIRIRSTPSAVQRGTIAAPTRRFVGTQSDGAARKMLADAEMREMDLAKRRGELTPTSEVDQGGRDAIALMQSAFDRAVESEAAGLSVKYGWDERIARLALKGFARAGIEAFNREMRDMLDRRNRARAAGDDPAAAEALQ
ncbi:hypothetical protein JYU29_05740 [Tianweitania sp. BSSL-BM11]|uniref:Terminase small subunit n=1 Tax=Tianweitania aestuarii TaxID=2814886 RepID=A0ABS5RT01_9HYPH|nr:hypothetical protein [Tianweitania aestuarii]MBS9720188.1 hypothetical protein [Tianweitania aestuarii]